MTSRFEVYPGKLKEIREEKESFSGEEKRI